MRERRRRPTTAHATGPCVKGFQTGRPSPPVPVASRCHVKMDMPHEAVHAPQGRSGTAPSLCRQVGDAATSPGRQQCLATTSGSLAFGAVRRGTSCRGVAPPRPPDQCAILTDQPAAFRSQLEGYGSISRLRTFVVAMLVAAGSPNSRAVTFSASSRALPRLRPA